MLQNTEFPQLIVSPYDYKVEGKHSNYQIFLDNKIWKIIGTMEFEFWYFDYFDTLINTPNIDHFGKEKIFKNDHPFFLINTESISVQSVKQSQFLLRLPTILFLAFWRIAERTTSSQ